MYGIDGAGQSFRARTLIFVATLAILIAAQATLGKPLLRWLLQQELTETAVNWSAYLFHEIDRSLVAGDDGKSTLDDDSIARLSGVVEAALQSGAFRTAIIFREHCACQVTLGDDLTMAAAAELPVRIRALFEPGSDITQPHGPAFARLDRSDEQSLSRFTPTVRIDLGDGSDKSFSRAEFTFFRQFGGETIGLSIVFDATRSLSRLKLMLVMGALIVTVVLTGAGLLVARNFSRSNRVMQISEKQARFLAQHDPLTRLLNRFGFSGRADLLLEQQKARDQSAFMFQIDADKFKDINDLYGHPTGDRVIRAIADLLRNAFPPSALVARLGGDEFAVLVPAEAIDAPIEDFAERLPTGTDVVSEDGAKLIGVSISVGLAVFPDDGASLGELMQASDLALYSVKNAGRNAVGAYRRDMTKALERRHWELEGIREAIRSNQLVPHYQPLVNARDGRIEAVEALARWHHPLYGTLPPDRFSHALADARISTEVTREILTRVTEDMTVWRAIGYDLRVGLNVGEADLKDPGFLDSVLDTLKSRNLPPDALTLEVTEDALTRFNRDAARPLLEKYRANGGYVALDDFGTGNSSITLLKEMPYSAIKIDRSFIRDLTRDASDYAIVHALVRLSHDLGFRIVAEGVETPEQARILRNMRVDYLQGYLYSRPLPADKLPELLSWASPPRRKSRAA